MVSQDGHNLAVIKLVNFLVENRHASSKMRQPVVTGGDKIQRALRGCLPNTFFFLLTYYFEINVG